MDDLVDLSTGPLEPMGLADAGDNLFEKQGRFCLDHVIDHCAQYGTIVGLIETRAIRRRDSLRVSKYVGRRLRPRAAGDRCLARIGSLGDFRDLP